MVARHPGAGRSRRRRRSGRPLRLIVLPVELGRLEAPARSRVARRRWVGERLSRWGLGGVVDDLGQARLRSARPHPALPAALVDLPLGGTAKGRVVQVVVVVLVGGGVLAGRSGWVVRGRSGTDIP